jgi:soluble lytic murein transglycosylase-like protein
MNWAVKLILLGVVVLAIASTTTAPVDPEVYVEYSEETISSAPPSVQMYHYIRKYAREYDIPEEYAFSVAYQETGYRGPLHFTYQPNQTSFAGAKGAMQIMPATAAFIQGKRVSDRQLLHDIELNVLISMKLLRRLKRQYKDWGLAFGAYNTGRPCVNEYARKVLNQHYNWITSI